MVQPGERRLERGPGPGTAMLGQGLMAGLVSGALFAAAEMIVVRALGGSWLMPWRMFASVILGESAVTGELTVGIFLVGFFVHFILAAVFGMAFAAVGQLLPRRIRANWGLHALIGTVLGVVLWAINFQIIARLAYPWFLGTNALAQILLHAFAFGLPVGIYLAAATRRELALTRPGEGGIPRRTVP